MNPDTCSHPKTLATANGLSLVKHGESYLITADGGTILYGPTDDRANAEMMFDMCTREPARMTGQPRW